MSSTQLTAIVPTETLKMDPGEYHVYVINPNLLTGQWLVAGTPGIFEVTTTPPPLIADLNPQRIAGNESCTDPLISTMTITGTGFDAAVEGFYLVPEAAACHTTVENE